AGIFQDSERAGRNCAVPRIRATLDWSIVVDDFDYGRKRNLHDFAISAFNFHCGRLEWLRGLHAAHDASDTMTVPRDDFNIRFPVERLQRRQSSGYFHFLKGDNVTILGWIRFVNRS